MIEQIPSPNENTLMFKVGDKITQTEMQQMYTLIKARVEQGHTVNIYVEMEKFPSMTMGAIWEEVRQLVPDFKILLLKINKIALVTDKEWMQKISDGIYSIIGNINFKSFSVSDKSTAKDWIGI
ncbi:STAS/SEC14 domain-containing protein [Litoribacter ruber]|uniref:STAS/SEC14 domain-containing protein n=1 Tax=Litoribacter ruber TaxID=702568 RepID=A0AAP2CIB2_9BACT|nr:MULTISPECIES: STAS/SEC14 domain-containing protein [Litoribacter]MBS9523796.1 STAS/SEC14 domain-containing protein [Litoribacter alkaliphilus]MBT0811610.1 STAS/SEC14 domain-containing protein [Litoribacter ruber]